MPEKYDIHQDFSKFPRITLSFGRVQLWLVNTLMKLQCFFVRRKLRLTLTRHHIGRPDGSRLKIWAMTPPGIDRPAPALIYYHGGAFGITYTSLHLKNCERYAREAGCIVIFVDYRLAPTHPFPEGFNDSYATLQWVVHEAEELGIDPRRIAVGGDSAGGALAAGVAQKARDENLPPVCAQLLIYPVLDNTCSTASATDFVDVPLWNAASNRRMWEMYLSRYPEGQVPSYAAPGHGTLHSLPRTYVETAEFDPLRDEGLKYISDLQAQNVEVVSNETLQTIHGYDGNSASSLALQSMLERIAFLKGSFTQ